MKDKPINVKDIMIDADKIYIKGTPFNIGDISISSNIEEISKDAEFCAYYVIIAIALVGSVILSILSVPIYIKVIAWVVFVLLSIPWGMVVLFIAAVIVSFLSVPIYIKIIAWIIFGLSAVPRDSCEVTIYCFNITINDYKLSNKINRICSESQHEVNELYFAIENAIQRYRSGNKDFSITIPPNDDISMEL